MPGLTIHWMPLAMYALLACAAAGVIWPLIKGPLAGWRQRLTFSPTTGGDHSVTLRGSDEAAPAGTAKYLKDLADAAPGAPPDFVLEQAKGGATLAECMREWIQRQRAEIPEKAV